MPSRRRTCRSRSLVLAPRSIGAVASLLSLAACATSGPLAFSCPGFRERVDGGPYAFSLAPSALERQIQRDAVRNSDADAALTTQGLLPAPATDELEARVSDRLTRDLPPTGVPERGILLLSGGGQWGAFGAGFLAQLARDGNLPRFEVITGVSTGALQALFLGAAQAGDADAYGALLTAYSPTDEKQIVDRHPFLLAALYGSVAGLKPLRARVEQAVCADFNKPCLLNTLQKLDIPVYLGFVEADSGAFTMVDAVRIAKQAPPRTARDCITGAALASAGMPVFLQQIRVAGRTYYDGGVRESVFLARVASSAGRALAKQAALVKGRQLATAASPTVPLYVVRNGPTVVDAVSPSDRSGPDHKADALTAAQRAEPIIVNQIEVGSIAALRLEDPGGDIRLVTADGWNGAQAPNGGCVKPPKVMFDRTFMSCLRAFGASKAADAGARWIDLDKVVTDGAGLGQPPRGAADPPPPGR